MASRANFRVEGYSASTDGSCSILHTGVTDGMRRPVSDGMLYARKLSTRPKHKR